MERGILMLAVSKARLMTLVVVASLGLAGGVASAGVSVWTSSGPEDGIVNALAVDPVTPATVYTGTNGGGVFKSANGGGNWTPANTGLTNPYVHVLAVDPCTPALAEAECSRASTGVGAGPPSTPV